MRVYGVDGRIAAGLYRIHELSAAKRRSPQRNFMKMPAAAADYSGAIVDPQPSRGVVSSRSSDIWREIRHDHELVGHERADHGDEHHADDDLAARGIRLSCREHIGFARAKAA